MADGEKDRIDLLYLICYHLVWDGGGGGICADGLAFWDIQYGEMLFVSSWISNYWEIAWEIGDRTGARSGYLDGDLLGFFLLVLWDLHLFRRSGYR